MRAAIVVFPGSNRDGDVARALVRAGARTERVWHAEPELPDGVDLAVLPGGFSYGDYLRCGAIAGRAPAMEAVRRHAARGRPAPGIGNGCHIPCESGTLPGRPSRTAHPLFLCPPPIP
ncbi:MAG: phosphoribosylformylglycinamidine synthase subunit PurQ, partial [Salinarimonas sp.]